MKLDNIGKIFTLGDLHLGIRNNSIEWNEIQENFLLDFFLKKLEEQGFNPETDVLFQLGDVFHSRESINVRIQNKSFGLFKSLSKIFKRGIYIILGNHDVYYKDRNDINSVASLRYLADNIHVFENPTVLTINDTHNFLMLPWIDNDEKLTKIVHSYMGKSDYLMCHTDIKGLHFNRFVEVQDGINIGDLSRFKRVYSGHIHHRQELKNVLYTGTPYQMDRGDRDNTKGFYILDVSTPKIKETFVENTVSPIFVKYDVFDILNKNELEIEEIFKNNFVDIMIEMSFSNQFSVTRFLDILGNIKLRRIEFFTYLKDTSTLEMEFGEVSGDFNIFKIFDNYLDHRDYPIRMKENLRTNFFRIHKKVKGEKEYE